MVFNPAQLLKIGYISTSNQIKMRLTVGFGVFLFFLLNSFSLVAQEKVSATARATMRQTEIDLGRLEQGQPQTVVFKMLSHGSSPAKIYKVKPACGCTGVKYPKELIPNGQEAEIEVTYDAKATGSFEKEITVKTNAANASTIVLVIRGRVVASQDSQ